MQRCTCAYPLGIDAKLQTPQSLHIAGMLDDALYGDPAMFLKLIRGLPCEIHPAIKVETVQGLFGKHD